MLLLLEAYFLPPPPRISGGKRIAAFTIDDNGKLRRDMDALVEAERRQGEEDTELIAAVLAYWRRND